MAFLLAAATSAAPIAWLAGSRGWPANHETLRLFRRLAIFAGQWRAGVWVPVWSSTAFGGHGSPSPIVYNKLFNVLSGGLWELLGDARLAVCASFFVLNLMALWGMADACRVLLGRRNVAIAWAAGLMVVFSTYATTDWLTRGAAAEYAAFALVPALFGWCLRLVVRGVFSVWIGPLMALICLAHASIGLACVVPLGAAVIVAVLCWPDRWRDWLVRLGVSLAICVGILAPFIVAAMPYPRLVSFDLLAGITPIATHLAFSRVFWEPHWVWGGWAGFLTVQIDPLLLLAGILAAVQAVRSPRHRPVLLFLLGIVAAVLFLQTRQAFFLYRVVPGASWLQFAFRLLMFLVVALALCGAVLLDRLWEGAGPRMVWVAACAIAVAMSLGKPWLGAAPSPAFSDADIVAAATSEVAAQEPWEYYPWPLDLRLTQAAMFAALEPAPSTPCLGMPLDDMTVEHEVAHFSVSCAAGSMATLPITFAPGMRFDAGGVTAKAVRICPDIHPHVAVAGDTIVTVRFPNFWTAIAAGLSRKPQGCRPD